MHKIDIIAVGRLRKGPLFELAEEYIKRTKWPVNVSEIESNLKDTHAAFLDEAKQIRARIDDRAFVIVLDERGNGLRSLDFAKTLQNFQDSGEKHIQFIIGGADGLSDDIKDRANMLLSFGQQTWPHLLARVMLLEQIYRAQQILAGHPYHRE